MKSSVLGTKRGLMSVTCAASCLLVAACGGGAGNSETAAAPISQSTPSPGPVEAAPPSGASAPAPEPPASAPPSPGTTDGTGVPPSDGSRADGDRAGGAVNKSTSGYLPTLLTGLWQGPESAISPDGCVEVVRSAACTSGMSLRTRLRFNATDLAATRIQQIEYFRGPGCLAGSLVGRARLANDIGLDGEDTLIADGTQLDPAARIAVRRGVVTSTHFDVVDSPDPRSLFDECQSLNPELPRVVDGDTYACSQQTVALRIESRASGPVLLLDEHAECQPGLTPPAARPIDVWRVSPEAGAPKLP